MMKPKIFIRVDSSSLIGNGHLYRCLALGHALCKRGALVSFLLADLPEHLASRVEEEGFAVYLLPPSVEGHEKRDAQETISYLIRETEPIQWLVVDHYKLGQTWEQMVRPLVRKLLVIDDFIDRPHDCDLLLNENEVVEENPYATSMPEKTECLIGPRYALIRSDFAEKRKEVSPRPGTVGRILISLGTDLKKATLMALRALRPLGSKGLQIDILIGKNYPDLKELKKEMANHRNLTLHQDIRNVADRIAEADLAIGAGGRSAWERCCLGLPTVTVSTADNQIRPALTLMNQGGSIYLGDVENISESRLTAMLSTLVETPHWVRQLSTICFGLVDGKGADRVAQKMISTLTLRQARPEDCDKVYQWRNSDEIRHYSVNSTPLSLEGHREWFAKALKDPKRIILIAEGNGEEIGVLRYDLDLSSAEVSIYLVPGLIGVGYGPDLLRTGHEWLKNHHPEIHLVTAQILSRNKRSQQAFKKTGFQEEKLYFTRKVV